MIESAKNKSSQSSRITHLRDEVLSADYSICTERATIYTKYFKKSQNRKKPIDIQMAEALSEVLREKSIEIYPKELIVGNFSSKRVGGSIYPELHGFAVMLDIFKFSTRAVNPLKISRKEKLELIKTLPFWSIRFLAMKAFPKIKDKLRFILSQLKAKEYVINESGGIAHFAPDYEKIL